MDRAGDRSPHALAWRMAVAAAACTALIVALPVVRFAYEAPALRVALESVNAVVGLVVAYLVYGRYRASGRAQDLLLVLALTTVAVANFLLTALPAALPVTDDLGGWAPLAVRMVGTVLLTAAALMPSQVTAWRGVARRPALLVVVTIVVLALLDVVLQDRLPAPVDPDLVPADAGSPLVGGHPAVLAAQVVSGGLYAVAAVAFTRQGSRERDELLRWLGAGCVLAAFARVHYLLFPSLYSDYVYTGDVLRLGLYACMLIGAAREIRSFWEAKAHAAVLEDRRRLARDLHDGLIQELTYVYAQSRALARRPGDVALLAQIEGASGRAIDEARTAIAALTRVDRACFSDVLREAADGLAGRYAVDVAVDVDDDVVLEPQVADAVLRIVGEALRNGVRHGGAGRVRICVGTQPLSVTVVDDGKGFDPAAANKGGFGLTSMRERAEGLGGRLTVDSAPGAGTTVRVVLP